METTIRWHGRARHGTRTAVKLLSQSVVLEGRYVQAYPDFHCSHLGEPIIHFTRIREVPFVRHSPSVDPSVVVVLDADLILAAKAHHRLLRGGLLLANSPFPPEDLQRGLGLEAYRVSTLDGTAIALSCLGEDLPNAAMLGALARITGVVELGSLERQIWADFGLEMSEVGVRANVQALHRGYQDVLLAEARAQGRGSPGAPQGGRKIRA